MSLEKEVELPRKTTNLFILVDTSGSMAGAKIEALNEGIREAIPDLREISEDNADAKIKIAVLQFSSGTQWLTPTPAELDNYFWTDLKAGGVCDFGAACDELNLKLNKDSFLADPVGIYHPVIILLSDGQSTDGWKSQLELLQKNLYFMQSIRIAVSFSCSDSNIVNYELLEKFTGNKETVITDTEIHLLKRQIHYVIVQNLKNIMGALWKGRAKFIADDELEEGPIADDELEEDHWLML